MEERLTELATAMSEEEEKVKQLSKLKNKYEAIIADLEERLKKEQQVREFNLSTSARCMVIIWTKYIDV